MDILEANVLLDRWIGPEPDVSAVFPVRSSQAGGGLPVVLSGVSKAFGRRIVLDDMDLEIEAGTFVSVVGRSGEGKSTLLRLLTGLDRIDRGSLLLGGMQMDGVRPDVTIMFQDPRLLPWERVLGNVGIGRAPGWRARAQAALREVGLADRGGDWPAMLSGGQRQRVALARALLGDPGLLLLDEPLGALDALTRAEMQRLIERLWLSGGMTAILVTHDVTEAVNLSDRILVLRGGRIALDLAVPLSRPRRRSEAEACGLESRILDALLA